MSTTLLEKPPAKPRTVAGRPVDAVPAAARRRAARCAARAGPAPAVGLPGDVRRRGRRRVHHGARHRRAERRSPGRSPSGCGSPWCSRRSPSPWPRGAARRRPRACGRRSGRRPPARSVGASGEPTDAGRRRRRSRSATSWSSSRARPSPATATSSRASRASTSRRSPGESAPVIRESGGDRSAVTGGTVVLSDRIVVRITAPAGHTFVDRMIALVEGSERQKTPNEVALNVLLTTLTIIFLLAVVTLQPFAVYSGAPQTADRAGRAAGLPDPDHDRRAAVGHRHRGHGPAGPAQRAGDVRPRGRGRRRRRRAAARQDRHDHARQPAGGGPAAGRRASTRRTSPTPRSCPRWPTRPPRAARSSCWSRSGSGCASAPRATSSAPSWSRSRRAPG